MKIVVVDYKAGNIRSMAKAVEKALENLGYDLVNKDDYNHQSDNKTSENNKKASVIISNNADDILTADKIILPGDGAFPSAMQFLEEDVPNQTNQITLHKALNEAVISKKTQFLGVCIGMQILASTGYEDEETKGFGWIKGEVRKIELNPNNKHLKIPHMGWNVLNIKQNHPILDGLASGKCHVYFLHSYAFNVASDKDLIATTDHGSEIAAVVAHENIIGLQFHPEKSQKIGIKILENFIKL